MPQKSSLSTFQNQISVSKIIYKITIFFLLLTLFGFGYYLSQYKFSNELVASSEQVGKIIGKNNDIRLKQIGDMGWSYNPQEILSNSSLFIGVDSFVRFQIGDTEFYSDKENTIISFMENSGTLEVKLLKGKLKVKKVKSRKKTFDRKIKVFKGKKQINLAKVSLQEKSIEKLVSYNEINSITPLKVSAEISRKARLRPDINISYAEDILKIHSDEDLPSDFKLEVHSNKKSQRPLLVQKLISVDQGVDTSSLVKNGTYYVRLLQNNEVVKKSKIEINRDELSKVKVESFLPPEGENFQQEEISFKFKLKGFNLIYTKLILQISQGDDFAEVKSYPIKKPLQGIKLNLKMNEKYNWKLLVRERKSTSSKQRELISSSFILSDKKIKMLESEGEEYMIDSIDDIKTGPVEVSTKEKGKEDVESKAFKPKKKYLLPKPIKKETQEATYSFE